MEDEVESIDLQNVDTAQAALQQLTAQLEKHKQDDANAASATATDASAALTTIDTKFLRDLGKWVDDDWPPGRVVEAIAARGWASAEHDPRGNRSNGLPTRQADIRGTTDSRGQRPNRCLDMLYAAEEEIHSGEDPEPDFPPRLALRAV